MAYNYMELRLLGNREIIIEIDHSEVRGVLFSRFFGRISVERTEALPVREGKISSSLERLLSGFPSNAAITLQLPGRLFMVRTVSFPFSDKKKIRKALPYELDGLLPYHVDELLMDCISSGPSENGNNMMALAVPKKVVSSYLGLFPEEKRPSKVIPDFVSLISTGMHLSHDETYGILEMGEASANIALISRKKPIMVRSVTGNDLQSVTNEVRATIKYGAEQGHSIGSIYITGKNAKAAESLLRGISNIVPLPAKIKRVSFEDKSTAILFGGSFAAVEYPSFNILGSGAGSEKFEKALKTAAVGAVGLLVLGSADLYLRHKTASQRLYALKAESKKIFLSVMPQVKRVVKEDAQLKDALNKKKEERELLLGKTSPSYIAAFNSMQKVTAEHKEIKIREAVFEGNSLIIFGEGTGIDADSVKKLFSGMQGATGVKVEEMVRGVDPNSYRFRVKIDLTHS